MPLRVLRYLDFAVLLLALPIFVAAGLPMLGWLGAAAGWTLQRAIQYGIEKRARASDDPRTVAGLLTGSMIARGWIVAGSIFVVGLAEREAGLARRDPLDHPLHLLLHEPDAHAAVRGAEVVSRGQKIGLAVFVWLGIAIAALRDLRERGQERGVQAAGRVQARPLDRHPHRRRRPVDQQGGALPASRLHPHDGHDDLHRQADAGPPQPRPDARRGRLRPHLHADRPGQHAERDGGQVLPVRRDAVLLHLVLEHARLHPAAGEQPRDDRHLRDRLPGLRALRGHGEPLDPARAHAGRLDPLPDRGHPPARPHRPPEGLAPRRGRPAPPPCRSSSSR